MLVINPDECIDCALCVTECPVDALFADDELPDDQHIFFDINEKYAAIWPVITAKWKPPADAREWDDIKDKYADHFDPNPGTCGS